MAEPGETPSGYRLARDTLLVRGPDRKPWLDGLLTCSVAGVSPGSGAYGLLLTKQGKIVSDIFLVDSGEELFLGVAPGRGAELLSLLDRYLVMEDAELSAGSPDLWWLVSRGGAPPVSGLARGQVALGQLALELTVGRGGAPAELAADDAGFASLLAAHGLGLFGVDFGPEDNPHEASLDRIAVSWTKGCYLGQEVVCMQDMRGKVKRRLVALAGGAAVRAAADAAEKPSVAAADGGVVGRVTSVHSDPASNNGVLLMASISSAALDSAAELRVLGEPVRVVTGPGSQVG